MCSSNSWPNASEAARRLGISIKALRLCEQQGLINPGRTLGLSLAQVARVLDGDSESLNVALSTHKRYSTMKSRSSSINRTSFEAVATCLATPEYVSG